MRPARHIGLASGAGAELQGAGDACVCDGIGAVAKVELV